jgi:hypothetical protein
LAFVDGQLQLRCNMSRRHSQERFLAFLMLVEGLVSQEWKGQAEEMKREDEGMNPDGGLALLYMGGMEGRRGRTFGANGCRKG